MSRREYYSTRTGKNPAGKRLDLSALKGLFMAVYEGFERRGYFQEAFGYYCIDAQDVPGTAGPDVEAYVLLKLRKSNMWPIGTECGRYKEDDLFDVVELLYDEVSKPTGGSYHSYGDCGWHYSEFDKGAGQEEFENRINELLGDYGEGYELSNGEILSLAEPGMEGLLEAELPPFEGGDMGTRVDRAILKFRRYRSSTNDKHEAVRALADVLEFLRPELKHVLIKKDEGDLFNIANNFAIRHHDKRQKTEYDESIWLSWMFYFYLATIHAGIGLINRQKSAR